jgi:hypothetical protein
MPLEVSHVTRTDTGFSTCREGRIVDTHRPIYVDSNRSEVPQTEQTFGRVAAKRAANRDQVTAAHRLHHFS